MLSFDCGGDPGVNRILAIGCHADDIEIGCGGTLLTLARANPDIHVTWVVLTADGAPRRGGEVERARFSRRGVAVVDVRILDTASASFRTTAPR